MSLQFRNMSVNAYKIGNNSTVFFLLFFFSTICWLTWNSALLIFCVCVCVVGSVRSTRTNFSMKFNQNKTPTTKIYFRMSSAKFLPSSHDSDVIMGTITSQITSLANVCSTVYSGTDQRKHQSSASLPCVRGILRWPVNSPHKGPVTRKMFPFDDVIRLRVTYFKKRMDEFA